MVGLIAASGEAGESGKQAMKPHDIEEIVIGSNALKMPLGRVLLIRKDSQYCPVKFTEAWTGKTKFDFWSNYESYYQGDGTGDFSNENVQFTKGQLITRRLVGLGKMFSFPVGRQNYEIKCGPIKLFWDTGWVYFYDVGRPNAADSIINEMAPTKWRDNSQVNVFDPRLKWYRYDEYRKHIYIPTDQLWEDEKDKK